MERFGRRENALLGYSPQRVFGNQSSSSKPKIRHSSDFDFQDVFGGPPRRYSMQEMGHSFRETINSSSSNANKYGAEEDAELSPSPLSGGFNETPVFGEGIVNRRQYPSDDFFDDIFRGDESVSSRSDIRDSFGASPGSRVLSPARPLPPRADPLGTSLPAQFQYSLPAKLTNAMDFPSFALGNRNPYKNKDPISNEMSCIYPPNSPLSGLSSDAFQEQDELRNETWPSCRPSPLSHEFSLSRKDSSCMTKSNELESLNIGSDLKKHSKSTEEAPGSSSHFHFSIYKWAGKGVPLLTPIRGVNSSKSKEKLKTERCSSSNGRIENDNLESGLQGAISCDFDRHFLSHSESVSANNESSITEGRKQDKSSLLKTKFINNSLDIVETEPDDVFSVKREEIKPNSVTGIGLCESTEKEIATSRQEDQKPELKPLRSLLFDTDEGQGNDERIRKSEVKDHMVKKTAVSHSNDDKSKKIKKRDEKINNSKRAEEIQVNEPFSQGSRRTPGDNLGKNGVKGKVKDFIKIFNQEATSKPKIDIETRSQSSRWKGTRTGTGGADNEGSAKTTQTNGEYHIHNTNKMKTPPNASVLVDENLVESEKQQSNVKTTVFRVNENSFGQKDVSELSSESVTNGSKVIVEDTDDIFHENFMIKELSNDQDKTPEIKEVHEDIQMSDAKIRQWKNGKEGNIRSLLSTLQYVLWPGSGWKPVPLVDIIEGSAVKRSYQKALLCLHPDKLLQKGVASHQKYIAAKVFDILQEAWDHFNSLGGM